MTREQLLARPIAGKWSTLEVVCHLADFDPILADRMKRIIAEDRPQLIGADENRYAARLAYADRDRIASIAARDPRIHPMMIPTSSVAGMKMKCPAVTTPYRPPPTRCAWRNSASTRPRRRHNIRTKISNAPHTTT